ncbi:hypothetical protein GCM10028784_34940 [Myceligenerans cantabricum]
MRHRTMPGRRAAAAIATALSLMVATAASAAPALAATPADRSDTSIRTADDPPGSPTAAGTDAGAAAEAKVSDTLRTRLEAKRSDDFWVRFTHSADLDAAPGIADWDERGRYVYDALTSTAEESQAAVVDELEAAGADFEPHWISNAIHVTGGSLRLAESLAADPAVARVHEPVAVEPVEPVERASGGEVGTRAVEWGVEAVNAPAVWDLGFTGEGITVSTVDSGAELSHPALESHYRGTREGGVDHDYNWFDASGSCDGEPCDNAGHGTHVTGTMVGDDGGGNQTGVAPGAEWIAANGCDSCSDADLIASAEWILAPTRADGSAPNPAMRPHVVNNSWGSQIPGDVNDFFADQVAAWEAAGIFGVWAAGNAGEAGCGSTSSPGANVATYAVGATNADGEVAEFSSRGPGEDGLTQPNVAAPGEDVRSSVPGGDYELFSGTSMAAPHVTAAVALLWSAAPSLIGDIDGTRDLLNASAVDHASDECGGTPENNNVYGEGDLDVLALVEAAGVEEAGDLAGTVTDAGGEPVQGATVTVGDRSTGTDAHGAYSMLLPVGSYDVVVEAFGFLAGSTEGVEVFDDETTTNDVVLERAPTTELSGTVTDGSGHGWPLGAKLTIDGAPSDVAAWSDPFTGEYSFEVPANSTHTVVVAPEADGYRTVREDVETGGDGVVHDAAVPVADACVAPGYEFGGADVPVEEFGSGDVPEGWAVEDLAGTGEVWTFDDAFEVGNQTGGDGLFAEVNSDGYGPDGTQDTTLTSAPLDFTAVAAPSLRFEQAFEAIGDFADVDLSVDGGETWETVLHQTASAQGTKLVALPDAGGRSDVRVRFHYGDGAWAFWWQIDDVGFGTCAPVDGGLVAGQVVDGNTGDGVVGASVSDAEAPDDGVQTVDPPGPHTGPGYYSLFVPAGDRTVVVADDGYVSDESSVAVAADAVTRHDVELAAPMLAVSPVGVSDETELGGAGSGRFTVTNEGTAATDVEVFPGSSDFEILADRSLRGAADGSQADAAGAAPGGSSGAVIEGVQGSATEVATAAGTASSDTDASAARVSSDGAFERDGDRPGTAVTPVPPTSLLAGDGGTTITHSASQEIVPDNSAACVGSATQVLRTFTLEDFDIGGELAVTNVSFGVESSDAGADVTVNLYTLDGALRYENMTEIGSATETLDGQALALVDVPVEGTAPAGSTLVAEITVPDGPVFFVGSNAEGETAPTYVASEACGNTEPVEVADAGFPDMHAVINVTGTTEVDVPWLDLQPPAFALEPGESATVQVGMDSRQVDQPGTYTSDVVANGATPYRAPRVAVSMSVTPPSTWGKIAGTVSGTACDGETRPLEGAFVTIDGTEHDVTLVTGPAGGYARWMGVSNNRLTLLSSANGYPPVAQDARILKGRTVVHDIALTEFCD